MSQDKYLGYEIILLELLVIIFLGFHIKPQTLNPEPLNPKPLNPKPLNPKPLNPKPQPFSFLSKGGAFTTENRRHPR